MTTRADVGTNNNIDATTGSDTGSSSRPNTGNTNTGVQVGTVTRPNKGNNLQEMERRIDDAIRTVNEHERTDAPVRTDPRQFILQRTGTMPSKPTVPTQLTESKRNQPTSGSRSRSRSVEAGTPSSFGLTSNWEDLGNNKKVDRENYTFIRTPTTKPGSDYEIEGESDSDLPIVWRTPDGKKHLARPGEFVDDYSQEEIDAAMADPYSDELYQTAFDAFRGRNIRKAEEAAEQAENQRKQEAEYEEAYRRDHDMEDLRDKLAEIRSRNRRTSIYSHENMTRSNRQYEVDRARANTRESRNQALHDFLFELAEERRYAEIERYAMQHGDDLEVIHNTLQQISDEIKSRNTEKAQEVANLADNIINKRDDARAEFKRMGERVTNSLPELRDVLANIAHQNAENLREQRQALDEAAYQYRKAGSKSDTDVLQDMVSQWDKDHATQKRQSERRTRDLITSTEGADSLQRGAWQARLNTIGLLTNPFRIGFRSDEVLHNENGEVKLGTTSLSLQAEIDRVSEMFGGVPESTVRKLIVNRGGIGFGIDGTIAHVDPSEFSLYDDQIIELLRDVQEASRGSHVDEDGVVHPANPTNIVNGRPGGVRDDSGRYVVIAGTRSYPMPLNHQLALELCERPGSVLFSPDVDPEVRADELVRDSWEEFLNYVRPDYLANTSGRLLSQALSLDNMALAINSMDGSYTLDQLQIPEVAARYDTRMMEAEALQSSDPDIREPLMRRHREVTEDAIRMRNRQFKDSMRIPESDSEAAGATITAGDHLRSNGLSSFLNHANSLATIASTSRTMLITSGILENADQIAKQEVAAQIEDFSTRFASMFIKNVDAKQYRYTQDLDSVASSESAIEAKRVVDALLSIGDIPLLNLYRRDSAQNGYTLNELSDFLERYGYVRKSKNPAVQKAAAVVSKVEHVLSQLQMGEGIFNERRVRQYVHIAMNNQLQQAAHGKVALTTDQLMEITRGQDGEALIHNLIETDGGMEALFQMDNFGPGRRNPLSSGVSYVLNSNGITRTLVRACFDKYPIYNIGKSLQELPFSNTVSYLSMCGVSTMSDMYARATDSMALTRLAKLQVEGKSNAESDLLYRGLVANAKNASSLARKVVKYQMGTRTGTNAMSGASVFSFAGLYKNVLYDMVNAGSTAAKTLAYMQIINALGGLYPPDDPQNLLTWTEWKVGGQEGIPWKMAWWLDDFSNISFPVGTAWLIYMHGDFDEIYDSQGNLMTDENGDPLHIDGREIAAPLLIEGICGLNDGNGIMEFMDLMRNWDERFAEPLGMEWIKDRITEISPSFGDIGTSDPSDPSRLAPADTNEWANESLKLMLWGLVGEFTPAILSEWCPMSRNFLFRGDDFERDARKVYSKDYDHDQAVNEYRTEYVGTWTEYMDARAAQNNDIMALWYDIFHNRGTGWMYAEQPYATRTDDLETARFAEYNFYLSDKYSDEDSDIVISTDLDEREKQLYDLGEKVCDFVWDNYNGQTDLATLDGFYLTIDARKNMYVHCKQKINEAYDNYREATKTYLPDEQYKLVCDTLEAELKKYEALKDFSMSGDFGWRMPRYLVQNSDFETRHVDDDGNAALYANPFTPINTLTRNVSRAFGNEDAQGLFADYAQIPSYMGGNAREEKYAYGNVPVPFLPFTRQRTQGKAYDNESIPYNIVIGPDGTPINDVEALYQEVADGKLVLPKGREGQVISILEEYWGGQGNHVVQIDENGNITGYDDEQLRIPAGDIPTTDSRILVPFETTLPDLLKMSDEEIIKNYEESFGISSHLDEDGSSEGDDSGDSDDSDGSNGSRYSYPSYYASYGGGYRYYGGGGGGYSSAYRPKIYSSSRQVYSGRASGMSTKQPYKASSTYLRPSHYTSGSRKSWSRLN